jgi:hypothetical protein
VTESVHETIRRAADLLERDLRLLRVLGSGLVTRELAALLRDQADAAEEHEHRYRDDPDVVFAGDETLCSGEVHALAVARALLGERNEKSDDE